MLTAKIAGHVKSTVSLVSFFLKVHLDFELLFYPKCAKSLAYGI